MKLADSIFLSIFLIFPIFSIDTIFASPVEDGYVGSGTCISCHKNIHPELVKGWLSSAHHLSMQNYSESSGMMDAFLKEHSLKKEDVLGVIGDINKRYVIVKSDFLTLPSKNWDEKESPPPHDLIGNKKQSVDASEKCLGCHTTAYNVLSKESLETGISCESCHGPGRKHSDSKGSSGTIVNPSKLSPDQNRMVCGQCHSLGKDKSGKYPFPVMGSGDNSKPFLPGDDLTMCFVDAKPSLVRKGWEYSLLTQSSKFYSSQLCTGCHNPHGTITNNHAMLKDPSNEMCLRCHGIGRKRYNFENHWGLGNALIQPCWDCHQNAHVH
jgi:predicted CXXCH cytochrome family protein